MSRMFLPAIRGFMGDWTYYSCLMPAREVAKRVRYAEEVHQNKGLSDLIQRRLKRGRGKNIADYLQYNTDRFFNALVIAVYEGTPTWHEFDDIRMSKKENLTELTDDTKFSLGFLSLDGAEQLFALDGQHRLAGIQIAVSRQVEASDDEIAVIFVGHSNSEAGLRRTRKLFTTLNKTAKVVSKADIILLDESDAMAIITRRLVDHGGMFSGDRIAFDAQTNISPDDTTHLTTIINLYDIATIILSKIMGLGSPAKLKLDRPEDSAMDEMLLGAKSYFQTLAKYVPPFREFVKANDQEFASVVAKYRNKAGGNLLFRPVGQKIFANVVAKLIRRSGSLDAAVKRASVLPLDLRREPFYHVLWDEQKGLDAKASTHTRDVLLYMLGEGTLSAATLRERRANFLGTSSAKLPARI